MKRKWNEEKGKRREEREREEIASRDVVLRICQDAFAGTDISTEDKRGGRGKRGVCVRKGE